MTANRLLSGLGITLGAVLSAQIAIAETPKENPVTMMVSLKDQRITLFRGTQSLRTEIISSGKRGHETPTGAFSVMEKRKRHFSSIYRGAPMPFMQRLTWSGIALHSSKQVTGAPASHGCIRLKHKFAGELFSMDTRGAQVIIEHDPVPPTPIKHSFLFNPEKLVEVEEAKEPVSDEEPKKLTKEEKQAKRLHDLKMNPDHPTRILITRRNYRDDLVDTQRILKELGLYTGKLDGYIGKKTYAAIRQFRTDNGLPESNKIDPDLIAALYRAIGKLPPPQGRILVRKRQKTILDAEARFTHPDKPLGSHLIHAVNFDANSGKTEWLATALLDRYYQGDYSYYKNISDETKRVSTADTLSRIKLTLGTRKKIEKFLSYGSSIQISDNGISTETAVQGTDFVLLTDPKLDEVKLAENDS